MSDAHPLAAAQGLALLDRLHEILARFAQKEKDLVRRLRDRRLALQRGATSDLENAAESLAAGRDQAEQEFAQERDRLLALHNARETRIRSLSAAGLRSLPHRAQAERERWLGDLQMRQFVTARRLESEQKAADEKRDALLKEIYQRRASLRRLERRLRDYFLGYPGLLLKARPRNSAPLPAGDFSPEKLDAQLSAVDAALAAFRALAVPKFFSVAPLWAAVPLIAAGVFLAAVQTGRWTIPALVGGLLAVALAILHALSKRRAIGPAEAAIATLNTARGTLAACLDQATSAHEAECRRIAAAAAEIAAETDNKWARADEIKAAFEVAERRRFERRTPRALERNERLRGARVARLEAAHRERLSRIEQESSRLRADVESRNVAGTAEFQQEEEAAWATLSGEWRAAIDPLYADIANLSAIAREEFPKWSPEFIADWRPQASFPSATKFADLQVAIPGFADGSRLSLPGPAQFAIPLALAYPGSGSLLFETEDAAAPAVISCLNQIILRLLATTPPGRLSFTILDPVGLGRNFAGLMHLGDYEESLISRRIWTQPDQIESRLADLNQHIEKIIQMYLRDEYPTIVEYNAQAGSTAEKFHFLVVADFPANFTETAIKRLQSIVVSGPRCGVYTLVHWDRRQPLPAGIATDELRRGSICIHGGKSGLILEHEGAMTDARLVLDPAPPPEIANEFIRKVGEGSTDANLVQVPFRTVAPDASEFWKSETTGELRIAIGRTGATKHQMLAIGKGTRQHALLAGKTGSGKSTLFHVLITNLALACSPEQVEFYLIDFKKGVEFKCYATRRLPHARVVAIESDREFGLSVLQRVDDELRRRGDLFRKLGAQDLPGFRRAGGEPIPRTLLIIDEFQEFFVEDDAIAQNASMLLDRIVRQGRAFGIHVLLGSQTLGGAYSLARATLGQMAIRIALQCNEADAYLIMDDDNPAPRLLSRPGEGIYNDEAGRVEGNSPFQVCWLPDDERDGWLERVRELAEWHPRLDATPIVFEGNAPANIAENSLLAEVLRIEPTRVPSSARAWLGAPNSIKGPTEVVFRRQSGSHLLVVGQRDEAALALLGHSVLALSAQYPAETARFFFIHAAAPGSADAEFIERIAGVAQGVALATALNLPDVLEGLVGELKRRLDGEPGPEIYVVVHGLQRFRKLRREEDFDFSGGGETAKPDAQFAELVTEGSLHGIHVLASIDTLANVNRFLGRKALGEFEMRVVFQMSANDSASLIDSPRAGALGLHRALLFNEQDGTLETFRPYAPAETGWLQKISRPSASIV